ncbi:hypothetical protein GCM10022398_30320 [Acetobacter lovaniensis]
MRQNRHGKSHQPDKPVLVRQPDRQPALPERSNRTPHRRVWRGLVVRLNPFLSVCMPSAHGAASALNYGIALFDLTGWFIKAQTWHNHGKAPVCL